MNVDTATMPKADEIMQAANRLRREISGDLHEHMVEAIYADAARIADRAVTRPGEKSRPTFDRTLDRVLTSRVWGFPIMIALFALMFWITIAGSNVMPASHGPAVPRSASRNW